MEKDIFEKIKKKWNDNDLQECSEYLDKLKYSATTGSEIIDLSGTYLMVLKRENGIKYNVAKSEINKFFRKY